MPTALPVVYIVCGRSYAGKTTLARQLAERLALVHLDFDDPLDEDDLDPRTMSQADWGRVYRLTYERFQSALAQGQSVVLGGSNKRCDRDSARAIAWAAGAETRLLYLNADETEVWRRWQRNAASGERAQLARETMELSLAGFEPPAPDEHALALPLPDLDLLFAPGG